MTTLHGIFRKLILRNIPALSDEDLDTYDSLLALRLELIHQRDLTPTAMVVELSGAKHPKFNRLHDFHPLQIPNDGEEQLALPGRVALNVFGASIFTYIHEFAHAMCSVFHGEIVDEYTDGYVLNNYRDRSGNIDNIIPWHSINRIQKDPTLLHDRHIGVHKEFASYNCIRFHSDLNHPSAEADWVGYYPERTAQRLTCAMDRGTGFNHFDPLISTFMYDRILAKLNRKKLSKRRIKRITVADEKKANGGISSHQFAFGRIFKPIGKSLFKFYKHFEDGLLKILTSRPSEEETTTSKEETQNTGGGNGEQPKTPKEKLDELIKDATQSAHQIIEPHRAEFEALHQLWIARRQLAFQQEDVLQIPTTVGGVGRVAGAFFKYKGTQISTFIVLAWERGKDLIAAILFWEFLKDILNSKRRRWIIVTLVFALIICLFLIFGPLKVGK